ncbi:GNAT family N-acetyltransferase [Enterobacteriaceae bacterium H4N4]|uniref:GNAT family N-acetyltransferase n=1 Tax=Silvania confinis TaxID=2926470 RepID=A0A9J6QAE3_9ENTR|nr:GNAT family N-acetyltransferase [Silvania confinis]MCU6668736.1 GNAT family N-acetyltransferase [Silvania confinis]
MITLRPLQEDQYPAYLAYFIPDYADEIAANYRLAHGDALARAKQETADLLPQGVNTAGHVLLCLLNDDRHVGYLWYKPDPAARAAFIYDFHILNAYQGQGLGKQALHALEQDLREKGFEQIKLRVAGDNARARSLYETSGFGVTGVNMSKTITA